MTTAIDITRLQQDLQKWEERLLAQEQDLRRERVKLEKEKEALGIVLKMHERSAMPFDHPFDEINIPQFEETPPLVISKAVDAALTSVSGNMKFTSKDIAMFLTETYPPESLGFDVEKNLPNISRCLAKLSDKGVLRLVEPSSGRRAAIYVVNQS